MLRVPLPPGISVAGVLFSKVARWVVVTGLAYVFFLFQRQAVEAAAQAHESEIQRIQLDQQMTEARLQSLRAQSSRTSCSIHWPTSISCTAPNRNADARCSRVLSPTCAPRCCRCGATKRRSGRKSSLLRRTSTCCRCAWKAAGGSLRHPGGSRWIAVSDLCALDAD